MGENELYQIAFHFREAIVAAKTNGEFISEIGCIDFQVVVAMTHVICLAFICGKNTGFTQAKGMDTMKLK